MASFKLSVAAPEFVPGRKWTVGMVTQPQQPQGYGDAPPVDVYNQQSGRSTLGEGEHTQFVQDTIYQMSLCPGNYDEYMRDLVDMLNSSLTDPRQLEDVANIVFDQSVLEPNFTYTGARMCEYLHKNLVLKDNFQDFRKQINKRAKDICVSRDVMVKHPEDVHRLRGATRFLTELFLNSEVAVEGQLKRIDVYRMAQKEMMDTLSNNPTTENFKCLGQIFKLAGKLIEDYDKEKEKTKLSSAVTQVFNNAKNMVIDASIDRDVRQMWLQLIERRACDWGRAKNSPLVAPPVSVPPPSIQSGPPAAAAAAVVPSFTNEPVFFSPDGKVISAAEAGFGNVDFENEFDGYEPGEVGAFDQYEDDADDYRQIEEAIAAATIGPGGDYHGMPNYDDWDPEVEAAFEQFQQESGYHGDYR